MATGSFRRPASRIARTGAFFGFGYRCAFGTKHALTTSMRVAVCRRSVAMHGSTACTGWPWKQPHAHSAALWLQGSADVCPLENSCAPAVEHALVSCYQLPAAGWRRRRNGCTRRAPACGPPAPSARSACTGPSSRWELRPLKERPLAALLSPNHTVFRPLSYW